MKSKKHRKIEEFGPDPYADYDYDLDDEFDDLEDLAKDFYSADWDDPFGSESKFSTRRKIERRNDMKELYSQFDDWDDIELGNDW